MRGARAGRYLHFRGGAHGLKRQAQQADGIGLDVQQALNAYVLGAGDEILRVDVEDGFGLMAAVKEVQGVAFQAVCRGPVAVDRRAVGREVARKAEDDCPVVGGVEP